MMIISGPPTNSPRTNSQPSRSAITIASSATRLVEAISNAIAEVKSAPRLKSERDRATAAYEQDDDAAPSAVARTSVRGRSSGSSRCISFFETAAWTTPDSAKPRISAQRIAQSIPNENESASTISAQMSTPTITW